MKHMLFPALVLGVFLTLEAAPAFGSGVFAAETIRPELIVDETEEFGRELSKEEVHHHEEQMLKPELTVEEDPFETVRWVLPEVPKRSFCYDLTDTLELENHGLTEHAGEIPAPIERLSEILQEQMKEYDGEWSVCVKNLNTGESFVINDCAMKSASIMKLFIMGTVYSEVEKGTLVWTDEIFSLMEKMITVSDNESSNQLLYQLGDKDYQKGIAKVNEFIKEKGFSSKTIEYNGFENEATKFYKDKFNMVTAKDCAAFLEDIYRRTWMSRSVSEQMEKWMLDQHTRYKIPAGLPEGTLCGNKTGELNFTENDAAIVYSDACDYILVILSSDWEIKNLANTRISELSKTVYEFMQDPRAFGPGQIGE